MKDPSNAGGISRRLKRNRKVAWINICIGREGTQKAETGGRNGAIPLFSNKIIKQVHWDSVEPKTFNIMKISNFLITLLAAALLSGCFLEKEEVEPELPEVLKYHFIGGKHSSNDWYYSQMEKHEGQNVKFHETRFSVDGDTMLHREYDAFVAFASRATKNALIEVSDPNAQFTVRYFDNNENKMVVQFSFADTVVNGYEVYRETSISSSVPYENIKDDELKRKHGYNLMTAFF